MKMKGNTMKKYELIESDKASPRGMPLFQVVALRDFGLVRTGDTGGYIESEANLSHNGDCWVLDNAQVSGTALVYGDAWVYDNARVSGDARVYGDARVSGDALVYDNARVYGDALVFGTARVYDNAQVSGDARVYDNAQVSGDAREAEVHDGSEVSTTREVCDHADRTSYAYSDEYYVDMGYRYCPKCGEKL